MLIKFYDRKYISIQHGMGQIFIYRDKKLVNGIKFGWATVHLSHKKQMVMQLKHGWKNLESEADFQTALKESYERPVVIFKHSTSCGISAHKFYDMETDWKSTPEEIAFYYLDLLAFRPISSLVAQELRVMHQSPQVLILKDGKAVANSSHAYATYEFVKKSI